MQGISGIASADSMPRNCGMQGMHGNTQTKQALKTDDSAVKQHLGRRRTVRTRATTSRGLKVKGFVI